MIKINLATRKQSGLVPEGTKPKLSLSLGRIKTDQLKDLPIRKLVISVAVGLLASYSLDGYKESEIESLNAVVAKLTAKRDKQQEELKKFKEYEEIKKAVDADELLVRTKLEVIQKLISDR